MSKCLQNGLVMLFSQASVWRKLQISLQEQHAMESPANITPPVDDQNTGSSHINGQDSAQAAQLALAHAAYDSKVEGNVIFTRVDAAINWMRKNSLWPMPMGLACCAIELMATASSRFDISRFGSEVMRFSPRQSDVMIVAGTVTYKMALAVKRVWDQMPEPKWCIAMGACASSGGMYRSYAVLQGIDQLLPVDVYISGCPPRPEALIEGLMKLQRKIDGEESTRDLKADPAISQQTADKS